MIASMQTRAVEATHDELSDQDMDEMDTSFALAHGTPEKVKKQKKTSRGLAVLTPSEALREAREVVVGTKGESRKGIIAKVTKLAKKPAVDVAADKKPSGKHVAVKSESALHPAGRM